MKVRELSGWPPDNFSRVGHGTIPVLADQVTIGDVLHVLTNSVLFTCGYEDETVRCTFFVPNENTAKKVGKILEDHKGQNLLSIREVEIPRTELTPLAMWR